MERALADAGSRAARRRPRERARHQHARRRSQRGARAARRVRRARRRAAGVGDQVDDGPSARRGRRGRGDLLRARARDGPAAADDESRSTRIPTARSTTSRTRRGRTPARVALSNAFGFGGVNASLLARTSGVGGAGDGAANGDGERSPGRRAEARAARAARRRRASRCSTSAPTAKRAVDYPDCGGPAAEAVSRGDAERGIVICGSGLGVSYTANRFPHVRAALALGSADGRDGAPPQRRQRARARAPIGSIPTPPGRSSRPGSRRRSRAAATCARVAEDRPRRAPRLGARALAPRAARRRRSRDRAAAARRGEAPGARHRADRVGELRLRGGARSGRLGAHQQVRRGLSGPALLRRLRGRRRGRGARDRARQGAVRRRARERAAARGLAGERGGVPRGDRGRRHDPRDEPRPRRPPDARQPGELLGQALQDRPVRRAPRHRADRLRRGAPARARAPPEADPVRHDGLLARDRLRGVPRDRGRGRRGALRRHRAHRRARRGGRAPVADRPRAAS